MELYNQFIRIIDANLILCLFPMVLTLILIKWITKDKFNIPKALNLIRWIVISYTLITILHLLMGLILQSPESAFSTSSTRTSSLEYWLMFLSATILPLTLFNKKLASNSFYLLSVVILMKIGWYIERFIVAITSENIFVLLFSKEVLIIFSQGFIFAIVILVVIEVIKKKEERSIL